MPSSNQCAIGTDGNLLDEREIIWYNDAEDSVPISPGPAATSSQVPSTSSVLKTTTLHSFFHGASTPGPAVFVAADKEAQKHSLSLIDFSETDDDEPAGPKWKGKGCTSDHMDMLN